MEDELLLSAEDILDNATESEVLDDENDIIDISEDSDYLEELPQSDNQLVITQELLDSFQEFLTTSSGSVSSDFMSEDAVTGNESYSIDYTDILEDIHSGIN